MLQTLAMRQPRSQQYTAKMNWALEGKFRNLNFSPTTKETTEYCFELSLSIYRY